MTTIQHGDMRTDVRLLGREQAPLAIVDDLVASPEVLVEDASRKKFGSVARAYPGIRAAAGSDYEQFLLRALAPVLGDVFGFAGRTLRFRLCHYSLVTTPPGELSPMQRIPHVDSVTADGIATIHYLFDRPLGGTAFYRHRATGFEVIDEAREQEYFECVRREMKGPAFPATGYINGSTDLFEQTEAVAGRYNRILVYRLNSLHSGCIDELFEPDADPATGRLSINSFIEAR
jgi:hypothetical protein